ncbi:MAG: protein kinase, partial [Acidobacteria bacterium]|nr:protein kinase [Acidobacteriota bacterium]
SAQVALKLVPSGTDREAREIVEAEQWGAELQQQFCRTSPYVPEVYAHGTEGGYFFVAMEYLDGENLSDAISRGPLPTERAAVIAAELCRFLEDADRFEATIGERQLRSLLHGDLKPRNVRITGTGQIKVLDFGIAKALSLSRKVTRNDFGSVAYLSPERLETGDVDSYADFWAVGVLLHEMLGGTQPFQAPDTRRLEQLILSRRPPPPLGPECPDGLRAMVAKLLGPSPAERYESARAIREDLERVAAGEATHAEGQGWLDRAHDRHATRRTRPPQEADAETDAHATRRTGAPTGAAPPNLPPPLPPSAAVVIPPIPAIAPPKRKRRRWLRYAVALLALGFFSNEWSIGTTAARMATFVPTRELPELAQMWADYDDLSARSNLAASTRVLRRALTQQTAALAEAVIGNYRLPSPTVREAQWRMAREALARAVSASPDNAQLKAALRYCDGHLHRINGEARKSRDQTAAAQHEFTDAVAAFREAAELKPGWPDPFLGLARTFIYGLEDVDRAADALNQAQRHGYTPSDRETVQLADGYRTRGDTLLRNGRQLDGLPQERDYLSRAENAYRQALTLYTDAVDYANVPTYIRRTRRSLDEVERLITALDEPMPKELLPAGTLVPGVAAAPVPLAPEPPS